MEETSRVHTGSITDIANPSNCDTTPAHNATVIVGNTRPEQNAATTAIASNSPHVFAMYE